MSPISKGDELLNRPLPYGTPSAECSSSKTERVSLADLMIATVYDRRKDLVILRGIERRIAFE
jgi:hypothetical protein